MNTRERVRATLNHQQPDKTPYQIGFTQKSHQLMVDFFGDPNFHLILGNSITRLECEPAKSWIEIAPDIWQDQFGVQWDRSIDKDIGNVCNQLVTPEMLNDYVFPNPDDPTRYENYAQVLDKSAAAFTLVNLGFSLYERAWTLYGMENLMMAMIMDKQFVHNLLDRILEFNLAVIENACRYDIDAMMFGDDWGMQTGLQMGEKLWLEFIYPRLKQMYGLVKSKGKFVFIHSCGKVDGVFPRLIDIGLDVFNPFQPEVMDVFEMKRQFGDQLTFFGGISVQKTLPYGTVDEVKAEVRRLLAVVGKNGGYIAAPSHGIPGDAKPENIAAMIEVLQNQ
jgi:uroporphyrinogen decarboxylase